MLAGQSFWKKSCKMVAQGPPFCVKISVFPWLFSTETETETELEKARKSTETETERNFRTALIGNLQVTCPNPIAIILNAK